LDKPGFADLDRLPAQVLAVELKQVEGAEHSVVVAPGAEQVEDRETIRSPRPLKTQGWPVKVRSTVASRVKADVAERRRHVRMELITKR
jgi:hypothetical protein